MAHIKKSDFEKLMQKACPVDGASRIAVACSGGPDSMTLALLMRDWAKKTGLDLIALIIDHRLRENSTSEAILVRDRLLERGIDAHILTRTGADKINSDVQNQARMIRYQLLNNYCVENQISTLVTGHHREDQAETFLLRLARGSGVDGLSAMQSLSFSGEIKIVRPLLDVSKKDILDTLADFGIAAVNDPSNLNEDFDRVKMRNRQDLFDEVGLTVKRLADTAKNMARARAALEQMTDNLLKETTSLFPEGYCRLNPDALKVAPDEIALRALSRVLTAIGGRSYPPRLDQVERLYENILSDNLQGGCTLAGCGVAPKNNELMFFRENAAIIDCQHLNFKMLWDGRYILEFDDFDRDIEVRHLGVQGWQQLKEVVEIKSLLPAVVRNSLPALWYKNKVLSVPHIHGIAHTQNIGLTKIFFIQAQNFSAGPFQQRV